MPLADKTHCQWHTYQAEATKHEGPECQWHGFGETAHIINAGTTHSVSHGTHHHKQRALHQAMVKYMQQRCSQTHGRAHRKAKDDIANLRNARVCQHAFDIRLHDADCGCTQQTDNRQWNQNLRKWFRTKAELHTKNRKYEANQNINRHLGCGSAEKRRDGRWRIGVRIRQP